MNIFDERKRGFEEQFRLEEELSFRLTARRNRLFGKWVVDALGLSGSEAAEYAKSVMFADFVAPGDDDVITKVEQDLRAKWILTTRAQLRETLDRFAEQARVADRQRMRRTVVLFAIVGTRTLSPSSDLKAANL
jgi:hypothetical protein